MRRLMLAAVAALALTGCGGSDSTGPEAPRFPAIAGSYRLAGTFDGAPDVSMTGTATINAPSATGVVTGTVTMSIPALDLYDASATFADAAVTEGGMIAFNVDDGASEGVTWRFTGQVAGNSMSGRHTLSDASLAISGDWTLTRQASAVVAARAPATGPTPRVAPRALLAAAGDRLLARHARR